MWHIHSFVHLFIFTHRHSSVCVVPHWNNRHIHSFIYTYRHSKVLPPFRGSSSTNHVKSFASVHMNIIVIHEYILCIILYYNCYFVCLGLKIGNKAHVLGVRIKIKINSNVTWPAWRLRNYFACKVTFYCSYAAALLRCCCCHCCCFRSCYCCCSWCCCQQRG